MPLGNFIQPDFIPISQDFRLRKYDGHYELFLPGYQDPCVYQNSEGIFDASAVPDLDYVKRMCDYLSKVGEMYYIEVLENGEYIPIGDVTIKPENPPIAIWIDRFRGKGIGYRVLKTAIERLRNLGYTKIIGSTVYRWNTPSQMLHRKLGFIQTGCNEQEYIYELTL